MKNEIKNLARLLYETSVNVPESELPTIIDSFIEILSEKNLLNKTGAIIEEFTRLYNKENNLADAKLESSFDMSQEEIARIAQALNFKFKKEINLTSEIKPELIGGFKIKVEDFLFDASLKNSVNQLKQTLLS